MVMRNYALATMVSMLITIAMAVALVLRERSHDLTFLDNRVASTTRELVDGDPVASITLTRKKVTVAVYRGDEMIIRQSNSASVERALARPSYPRFDLSVLNLDRAGELLAADKMIDRIDIKATDSGLQVTAVKHLESQPLTTDFSPA